jgi:undecaprenyl diphosphate synthase
MIKYNNFYKNNIFVFISFFILISVPILWFLRYMNKKYKTYTEEVVKNPTFNKIYNLGLIIDGHKQWGKKHGYKDNKCYQRSLDFLWEVICLSLQKGIPHLTVYVLSKNNYRKKTSRELEEFYKEIDSFFVNYEESFLKNDIKCDFIGDFSILDEKIKNKIYYIQEKTKHARAINIHMLVGYDYVEDIMDAVKLIAENYKKGIINFENMDEDLLINYMSSSHVPPIDIIIRSGFYEQLSGFLPMQTMHSEIIFVPVMWPELTINDIKAILDKFCFRNKHFLR